MYLKKLSIFTSSGELIREVIFHEGLNIILGERSAPNDSTNSIGKTTLLRAIDFCLGGDEKNFYQDKENKDSIDQSVYNFFYNVEPTFRLEVTDSLKFRIAHKTIFERKIIGISSNNLKLKVITSINGNEVTNDGYLLNLKELFFQYSTNKPSFRQLIQKFIRKDDQQINFILRFLHQATSDQEYEILHFFLFGYPNPLEIEEKFQLEKNLKQQKNDIKVFDRIKPAGLEQVIAITQKDLNELIHQRDTFKINESYNLEQDKLNQVQNKIRDYDEKISFIEFEFKTLTDRSNLLKNKEFDKNIDAISLIYEEAKLYNLNLKKKFSETVQFHNTMLKNESLYLSNRIQQLYIDKSILNEERTTFAKEYSAILEKLAEYGSLAEYTKLNNQISEKQSKLSQAQALHQKSTDLGERLKFLEDEVRLKLSGVEKNIHNLQDNIKIFNEYFSEYCKALFNQIYYLSADPNEKGIHKFKISSLDQNLGSGKKISLVVAFDLAYTAFLQDRRINLKFPMFSTQDKIEIVDIQELYHLAAIANESQGQLIFPIIADKFSGLESFQDKIILRVSKQDRFFRIENSTFKPLLIIQNKQQNFVYLAQVKKAS